MNPLRIKILIIYQTYQKNKMIAKPNHKEVQIVVYKQKEP